MNIKNYISSGILESYVMGELTELEKAEVEKNLLLFPELKEELAKVEEAQESLLMDLAIQPRMRVKENIFAQIKEADTDDKKVIALKPEHSPNFWRYAAAASISVAIISSYLAYNYHSKWKQSDSQLTQLISKNEQIAKNYNQVDFELNELQKELQVIDDPAFTKVTMTGTPSAPQSSASVYWNESTQELYLHIHNMKELAHESQYQLWAIIDGKPVDAGVFDTNVAGLIKMKNIGKGAVTFAVTIEPRGGKTSPTLETMQVAGNVSKG